MTEAREIRDPFTGETVQINNDLVRRLHGEYANGPIMPNGDPEFGWRRFGEPTPIMIEAADEIERLRKIEVAAKVLADDKAMCAVNSDYENLRLAIYG